VKQILQNLRDGSTELAEVPCPRVGHGALLIRTTRSLVSAGTERMLVDFGKANPIEKARQQPDKVKQVLEKVKTDGLVPTVEAVRSKLEQPLALGYCNVGVVEEVGSESAFSPGDRIVSNGKHAEMVSVPVNLCARIPDSVSDEAASFTVIGAIALQGIRLVAPTLGEAVVVTGLGLIGLMTVQLLRAHGCRVLGIDMDPAKLALARQFGAETVDLSAGQDPVAVAEGFSRGHGVDAVIITAATRSNEPLHQAALMCRKRGRIVLVGVVGLELSRADFYEKELSFQVSCSYGPGRYDPLYEEQGQDYPIGYVRWTEQRNFEAVLDMLADGRLDVAPLVSHRFALEEAERAYAVVGGAEPSLGIILEYPGGDSQRLLGRTVRFASGEASRHSGREAGIEARGSNAQAMQAPAISVIGSGNYATGVLIPAFKAASATLRVVASSGGVSGVHAGRKFGFAQTTTDTDALFADEQTDALVITTRHDSHARFVLQALRAGKAVFVEKPLCLTLEELDEIAGVVADQAPPAMAPDSGSSAGMTDGEAVITPPLLIVGFNRRFAPHVQQVKQLLAGVTGPKAFVMTVNAGAIPADHWTQDPAIGGGRIVGEACHFIDLLRFLAGAPISHWSRAGMAAPTDDTVTLQLGFADGSIGTVHYFANGSKAFPKERLEVFAGGRVLQMDNFRRLSGWGWPKFKPMKLWRQDKGQKACAAAFVQALRDGGPAPIPVDEILEVSRVSIALAAPNERDGNRW
jgi:predicted dehydrogenase/threonine dehydrogenase-like Zn-dependent dehydrogenase